MQGPSLCLSVLVLEQSKNKYKRTKQASSEPFLELWGWELLLCCVESRNTKRWLVGPRTLHQGAKRCGVNLVRKWKNRRNSEGPVPLALRSTPVVLFVHLPIAVQTDLCGYDFATKYLDMLQALYLFGVHSHASGGGAGCCCC